MSANELTTHPPPIRPERRRADRRRGYGADLAGPEAGPKSDPAPRPSERVLPGPWPQGDFRVDPEA